MAKFLFFAKLFYKFVIGRILSRFELLAPDSK
jgi:hypothetical protein